MDGYIWLEFADGTRMMREVDLTTKMTAPGHIWITNKDAVEFGPMPKAIIVATIVGVTDDPAEGERTEFYRTVEPGDVVQFPATD